MVVVSKVVIKVSSTSSVVSAHADVLSMALDVFAFAFAEVTGVCVEEAMDVTRAGMFLTTLLVATNVSLQ